MIPGVIKLNKQTEGKRVMMTWDPAASRFARGFYSSTSSCALCSYCPENSIIIFELKLDMFLTA